MSTTKKLKKITDGIDLSEQFFYKKHYFSDDTVNSAFAFCYYHTGADAALNVVTFRPMKYKDFKRWKKTNLKCEKCNNMTVIPFFKGNDEFAVQSSPENKV